MADVTQDMIQKIQDEILEALEQVIDPELGVDIINLGLVYGIDLEDEGLCVVNMTLTSIGCPLADVIIADVERQLLKLDHVKKVEVKLVWTPAWTPDRMTRYARMTLGISR